MDDVIQKIHDTAQNYIPKHMIDKFIKRVLEWDKYIKIYFFQITQFNDKPQIEFGALTDSLLLDFTLTPEELKSGILKFSDVREITLTETDSFTELECMGSGESSGFFYKVVLDSKRDELLKYYHAINQKFIGGC